jgi:hypothetical protein
MPRKKADLNQAAEDAVGVTAFDRATDILTDLIAQVPLFGPILNAGIRQVMPRDHAIYLAMYFREVNARVDEMGAEKVDDAYFQTPEFNADVRRVIDALGMERNREKRRYYVAALANSVTVDRPELVERHRFLDLLEQLRPSHLRLLAVVARSHEEISGGTIDDYLRAKLPDQDLENVRLDWRDMERAGILAGIPSGVFARPISELVWGAFSAIGQRFAAFISATDEEAD